MEKNKVSKFVYILLNTQTFENAVSFLYFSTISLSLNTTFNFPHFCKIIYSSSNDKMKDIDPWDCVVCGYFYFSIIFRKITHGLVYSS